MCYFIKKGVVHMFNFKQQFPSRAVIRPLKYTV